MTIMERASATPAATACQLADVMKVDSRAALMDIGPCLT